MVGAAMLMSNKKDLALSLSFHHYIGNQKLVLDDTLVNVFGEKMVVRKFRYYITNLAWVYEDGNREDQSSGYFLIDEADGHSKIISIIQPEKKTKALEFTIGVDSIHNCSGIQTGVLDPMQGMFWTWNTGYIFAKLEGNAPVAQTAAHAFTYHIGGFKNAENAIRKIQLPIQDARSTKIINIKVDINAWFNGKQDLPIAKIPTCHSPGQLAVQFADNYARMFSMMQP
jgi:hypothetical protein